MELTDRLQERMKAGVGLVIYGFKAENEEATEFVTNVRALHDDYPIFSVSQKLSTIENSKAFDRIFVDMEAVRSRIRQRLPLTLTFKTKLEQSQQMVEFLKAHHRSDAPRPLLGVKHT